MFYGCEARDQTYYGLQRRSVAWNAGIWFWTIHISKGEQTEVLNSQALRRGRLDFIVALHHGVQYDFLVPRSDDRMVWPQCIDSFPMHVAADEANNTIPTNAISFFYA